jgi:hypothetical protein
MNEPARKDLLGFVLRALDRDEQAELAAELEEDSGLREELDQLQTRLEALGLGPRKTHFDPPAGLARRTCAAIFDQPTLAPRSKMREAADFGSRNARRMARTDFFVAAAVLACAAAIFFPALLASRFQSEVLACQNRLREIGQGLHEYAAMQPDNSFPRVALTGNRAAAGVYAPVLKSNELVTDKRTFVCPNSPLARQMDEWQLPTLEQLDQSVDEVLEQLQEDMGGSYGYNLGYVDGDRYSAPHNRNRDNYPLMADVPSDRYPGRVSGNHGGHGVNMLFESGNVRFMRLLSQTIMDDPFYNREGLVAAGVDPDDVVIAESSARPFTDEFQPIEMPPTEN